MNEIVIKVGDTVRVKDPDLFNVAFGSKIRDRDGIVEHVFTPPRWSSNTRATVRFLKRNGRGKEFTKTMNVLFLFRVYGDSGE